MARESTQSNASLTPRAASIARGSSHLVDLLVAAVVPRSGVPLAVLVGHHGAERVVDGLGGEVLGRDQHQAVPLADLRFVADAVTKNTTINQSTNQSCVAPAQGACPSEGLCLCVAALGCFFVPSFRHFLALLDGLGKRTPSTHRPSGWVKRSNSMSTYK